MKVSVPTGKPESFNVVKGPLSSVKLLKLSVTDSACDNERFTNTTVMLSFVLLIVAYADKFCSLLEVACTLLLLLYLLYKCNTSHIPKSQLQGLKYSTPWFMNSPNVEAYQTASALGLFCRFTAVSDMANVTPLFGLIY